MMLPLLLGLVTCTLAPCSPGVPRAADPVKVVTSLTTYAAIAREIAGDKADVVSIAEGDENPHFVQPRPSFVLALRRADMFVVTGLDLELWAPALLDKASNPKLAGGAPVCIFRNQDKYRGRGQQICQWLCFE